MAKRRSNSRSKYGRKNNLGIKGIFGIVIGVVTVSFIVGLLVASNMNKPIALNSDTLCPTDREPAGSLAVLIDNTDKIPERSARSAQIYLSKKINSLPENTLVSVFVMSEDSSSHIVPIISKCRPVDGESSSQLTANPAMLKRRFEEEFYTPLFATLNSLFDKEPSSISPILESLQSIWVESFQPHSDNVNKHLVVISDLLQHSPLYSMYSGRPDYHSFAAQAEKQGQNSLSLKGVEVELLVLPREVPVGTRADVVDFWQSVMVEKGALLGSSMIPVQ